MVAAWLCVAVIALLIVVISYRNRAGDVAGNSPNATADQPIPQGPAAGRTKPRIDQLIQRLDPARDEWDTEVLSEKVSHQLGRVRQWIVQPEMTAADALRLLAEEDVSITRPTIAEGGRNLFHDTMTTVTVDDASPDASSQTERLVGIEALAEALGDLKKTFEDSRDHDVRFKLVSIEKSDHWFDTQALFEMFYVNKRMDRSRQLRSTWRCRWAYPDAENGQPRLQSVVVAGLESATVEAPHGRLFVDCTESVLGGNPSYASQVLPGIGHWLSRISGEYMSLFGHHGLAVGDVNGDGLEDIYVCDAGGLPNRLYVQQADASAVDKSAAAGCDWLDSSTSALLVDLDNDGDQDLVVATRFAVLWMANTGDGRFTAAGDYEPATETYSMSAADYDNDGDLDLYLCGYNPAPGHSATAGLPLPLPYHDANNGGGNVLLRNEGQLRFSDVTSRIGLDTNNRRFSFAAAWADYDHDGDMDLYVANDFGRNNLYRNEGGAFRDVAAEAGVEDVAAGMSVAWADADRDGWADLYVGNMFSAAGHRVAYQRRFGQVQGTPYVEAARRMARGNTLFRNRAGSGFDDVSVTAKVTMGRWAWSSQFADLNNDGWPDLLVTNGYITAEDTGDL